MGYWAFHLERVQGVDVNWKYEIEHKLSGTLDRLYHQRRSAQEGTIKSLFENRMPCRESW